MLQVFYYMQVYTNAFYYSERIGLTKKTTIFATIIKFEEKKGINYKFKLIPKGIKI